MLLDGRPATGLGHYLRDIVYGANDGVVTTFAVVAGASGAVLGDGIAFMLGVANVLADGLSMGASNYLALKSELEQRGADVAAERPARHGWATFLAFAAAGLVPLLAFPLHSWTGLPMFPAASVLAAFTLWFAGGMRARFVRKSFWKAGMEMLLVGALAGSGAFLVGAVLTGWVT